MRRIAWLLLLAGVGLQCGNSMAEARNVVRSTAQRRTLVEVPAGWPLSRPARSVVVHPPRSDVRASCTSFLPVSISTGTTIAAVATPTRDLVAWEDGETLMRGEDWTQFTLNGDALGRQMVLEIPGGRVQLDWAEIVFNDGATQVVDFGEKTYAPGLYSMVDFAEGRQFAHVRVVARARTDEAKLTLRMLKE